MRALRVSLAVGLGLVLAAAAGTLIALAASTLRASKVIRPRMSICAGTWVRLDRSAAPLGITPLRARLFDWHDRLVWARQRRLGAPQKPWRFRTRRPGTYQVVFTRGSRTAVLDLLVTQCTRRVSIEENDRGQALFRLGNIAPGEAEEACVRVTYSGALPARVRLYGSTDGNGLERQLLLVVTRGWAARDEFPSCSSFVPDRKNYAGLGRGVVFVGTLAGLAHDWRSATDDAARGSRRVWRRGRSHTYRFTVSLPKTVGNTAQGLEAEQSFVWEARPLPRR